MLTVAMQRVVNLIFQFGIVMYDYAAGSGIYSDFIHTGNWSECLPDLFEQNVIALRRGNLHADSPGNVVCDFAPVCHVLNAATPRGLALDPARVWTQIPVFLPFLRDALQP